MDKCPRCGMKVDATIYYCPNCGAYLQGYSTEEIAVSSDNLVATIKRLVKEGNVRRIIVKNQKGENVFEIPVTVGVIGAILMPWMAALGVLATMAANYKIVVEKKKE